MKGQHYGLCSMGILPFKIPNLILEILLSNKENFI